MKTTVKMVLVVFTVGLVLSVMAETPEINGVMVRQRWPWSRLVDINYSLECTAAQRVDIVVEAYDGTDPLTLPSSSFSGDLCNVSGGFRHIVWDPTATTYTNAGMISKFRVNLTPVPVPLYIIVDLTKNMGDTEQVEYVYEEDLTNGLWGAWARNPVTNRGSVIESVIWIGVNTNDVYKTDKLVMRRIHATTFKTGDKVPPPTDVTLTKDFYAGVFEVTQRQWELIMGDGNRPSYFKHPDYYAMRPVEYVRYNDIRGATNSVPAINWPASGALVTLDSFLGQLRFKTGMSDFDLPTAAQWELSARAGTTTYYSDGNAVAPDDGVSEANTTSNLFLDAIGRYRYNGGYAGSSLPSNMATNNGTAVVGTYPPNAWGLYDTAGNVLEWCLDWLGDALSGTDPTGADTGDRRMLRGGSWNAVAGGSRVGALAGQTPDYLYFSYGFRLVKNLP